MTASEATRRAVIGELGRSPEPSIRWRTLVRVQQHPRSSARVRRLEEEVRGSSRVGALLSRRDAPFRKGMFGGVYRYWQGIHWVLTSLVDIGYPPGDPAIAPLLDRALGMWTHPRYSRTFVATDENAKGEHDGVPRLRGRYRRCASQQGNALLYATVLGKLDGRTERLAALLKRWQWADGGWNCDRSPEADSSSFMETLTPMRALFCYSVRSGSAAARRAAWRASEIFLERRLFHRRSDGRVMRPDFLRLHYPLYWHYDVLGGLKGMADLGRIGDPRCREALDWLEDRELARGGWPLDARYYRVSKEYRFGTEFVDWGAPHSTRRNDWVTTDALYVLRAAGRLAA